MNNAVTKTPLDSFYSMLRKRVADWLQTPEAEEFPCAALYRYLPDFFNLLAHLALDHRIPDGERKATLSALKYIVAPFDLIPEGVFGTSGFRDDLVLAALVVDRLGRLVERSILLDNWNQPGDPTEVARFILDSGDQLVGAEICEKLKEWLPDD